MSLAQDVLSRARNQGLQIEAKGTRLRLRAAQPPPAELLTELAKHKPAIISLLRPVDDCWSGDDYRALFDERAAIAEFDGHLTRAEAENTALESCIVGWLDRHPVITDPEQCVWCEGAEKPDCPVVPFGAGHGVKAWLHPECWQDWFEHRRQGAVVALLRFGIGPNTLGERIGGLNDEQT